MIGNYNSTYPVVCPNCHKPTMYIGDPPGPPLCDCWKKTEPYLTGALQGWICPVCGRGNSPFLTTCPCGPRVKFGTSDSSATITECES